MNYRRTVTVNLVKIIFELLAWPTLLISFVLLCLLQKFESEDSYSSWTTNNALILWIKDFRHNFIPAQLSEFKKMSIRHISILPAYLIFQKYSPPTRLLGPPLFVRHLRVSVIFSDLTVICKVISKISILGCELGNLLNSL